MVKVSAPANFQHFILPSKSFYSKFRWCNMHIWCSFLNIPSHLRENLLKSWLIYRKLKKNFHFRYQEKGQQERNLTPLSSIKFYWCAEQNLFTAWIHWQTTAAVCPTWFFFLLLKLWWLILLASCQNLLCSWNILRFLRHNIVLNLHYIGVSSHLIYSDNFAGRVKRFLGP